MHSAKEIVVLVENLYTEQHAAEILLKQLFLRGCAHRPKPMDLYAGWCKYPREW